MSAPTAQFVRGEFKPYKAVTQVHLGAIEDYLQEGEVVEYDGTTMRRGPDVVQLATLRAAIKVGWLVPEDEEGSYHPKAAGVEVRPAESRGRDRGPARKMGVVEDEEREVGTLDAVRAAGAPKTHHAKRAAVEIQPDGKATVKRAATNDRSVVTESGQEGTVVGKFKTSAKSGAVEVGKDDQRVKQRIASTEGVQVKKLGRAGDDLEDLLPDAASSGRPRPGIAGEGDDQETGEERAARLAEAAKVAEARRLERMGQAKKVEKKVRAEAGEEVETVERNAAGGEGHATVSGGGEPIRNLGVKVGTTERAIDASVKVSKGGDSVGFGDEGQVVGKIGSIPKGAVKGTDAESEITFSDDPTPEAEADPEIEAALAGETQLSEEEDQVPPEAILKAKIEMIQQFVPGFEWDMNMQWAKRAKLAVEKYGKSLPVLNAILSIETPAVRKEIMKRLYGEG